MKPTVGRVVHYTSYGTPGGEFPSTCRAALVTAVTSNDVVDLAVLNPEGMFFNREVGHFDVPEENGVRRGGTWHWPERPDAAAFDPLPDDDRRRLIDMIIAVERRRIAEWLRTVASSPIGGNVLVLADRVEQGSY